MDTGDDRVSKAVASYVDHPVGGERCQLCSMYLPPSRCTLVDGLILIVGWCKFFARRK